MLIKINTEGIIVIGNDYSYDDGSAFIKAPAIVSDRDLPIYTVGRSIVHSLTLTV